VVVRPIAGSGHPQLTINWQGADRFVQVESVAIKPSATYLKIGAPLSVDVLLRLQPDSGSWLQPGAYLPSISLSQGNANRPFEVKETSTPSGASNSQLSFTATGSTNGFQTGAVEITVTLRGASTQSAVSEFVVLMP
jgi:hypothetical protein